MSMSFEFVASQEEAERRQRVVCAALPFNERAQALCRAGHYAEAEAEHLRALAIKERGLRQTDHSLGLTYNALGETYIRLGRLDDAERFLRQAREVRVRIASPQELAVTRENLAEVFEMRGDLKEARRVRREGGAGEMICANFTCPKLTELNRKELRACATCKSIYYCSAACQKTDWKRHKLYCKRTDA